MTTSWLAVSNNVDVSWCRVVLGLDNLTVGPTAYPKLLCGSTALRLAGIGLATVWLRAVVMAEARDPEREPHPALPV